MSRTMPVLSNVDRMESIPGDEYMTAGDVFPIRVPLERFEIGQYKYQQSLVDDDPYDLELLYEMQTSDLLVRTSLSSMNNTAGPGTFRIKGIQAIKLELINEIPGSLEGMVTRLILELDQYVTFEQQIFQRKNHWSQNSPQFIEIKCQKITMISSIHETGHLRDVLLFLKSDSHLLDTTIIDKNNPYIRPFRSVTSSLKGRSSTNSNVGGSSPLTFLDTLPWWSLYLPWWLYSRNFRKFIQYVILLYSFFSIVWASWQLYRHVQFIHIALEPIVVLCREYLNDIMELLDAVLATLTYYWTTLLSPLNIFSNLLVLPIWGSLLQLKTLFVMLLGPLSKCVAPATSCLVFIWRGLMSSKLALQSLDISKIQRNYITNLIFSCLRAAVVGLANLVGYSKSRTKQKQALKNQAKYRGGKSVASPSNIRFHSNVPVYYNSPLLRQEESD